MRIDLVKINDTHIAEIRVNYTLKFKKEISKDTVLTSINNISRYITFNPFEIMLNNKKRQFIKIKDIVILFFWN